jgi:hypothetical protein
MHRVAISGDYILFYYLYNRNNYHKICKAFLEIFFRSDKYTYFHICIIFKRELTI